MAEIILSKVNKSSCQKRITAVLNFCSCSVGAPAGIRPGAGSYARIESAPGLCFFPVRPRLATSGQSGLGSYSIFMQCLCIFHIFHIFHDLHVLHVFHDLHVLHVFHGFLAVIHFFDDAFVHGYHLSFQSSSPG